MTKRRQHFLQLLAITVLILSTWLPVTTARADQFTQPEKRRIQVIKKRYRRLSHAAYGPDNMYQIKPRFNTRLQRGQLTPHYQNQLLAYVNFYRDLAGLQPVRYGFNTNQQAQVAAATMAASGGFSHGLTGLKRPHTVTKQQWQTGQQVTAVSNIGEMNDPERIDATIGNYVRDNFNVEGNNTGHRAWLMSPVIHTIGIGVANQAHAKFAYSDVYFADQAQRSITPNRATVVNYPSAGVFPRELLVSDVAKHPIYWSSNFTMAQPTNGPVKVTITDTTTKQTKAAKDVVMDGKQRFGQFGAIIHYQPTLAIKNGHHYVVKITGLQHYPKGYQYDFKPFSLTN
ncbi:CAP domain-containing protein [Furfurilactobacillus siliginis]|uniref:SCP domain-containing protein n=2 Tax=Furfurilactobacillus siliginis TaxID=348151 RepID=A0A0R2L5U6_9LACO|nr:CAP domain-containing protein [Furfurilactobacillus siliginis]KRN96930.1 hypothetical protein IV55_GL000803 [Furfurilactobacillus siliginis]